MHGIPNANNGIPVTPNNYFEFVVIHRNPQSFHENIENPENHGNPRKSGNPVIVRDKITAREKQLMSNSLLHKE